MNGTYVIQLYSSISNCRPLELDVTSVRGALHHPAQVQMQFFFQESLMLKSCTLKYGLYIHVNPFY